jgi:hypothetical protein
MRPVFALLFFTLALPAFADGVVLTYRGANHWVAPGDNKSQQVLLKAAEGGQTTFEARLPSTQRDLATARLEVLRDLLAQKSKDGVTITEVDGAPAAANTLWIK